MVGWLHRRRARLSADLPRIAPRRGRAIPAAARRRCVARSCSTRRCDGLPETGQGAAPTAIATYCN